MIERNLNGTPTTITEAAKADPRPMLTLQSGTALQNQARLIRGVAQSSPEVHDLWRALSSASRQNRRQIRVTMSTDEWRFLQDALTILREVQIEHPGIPFHDQIDEAAWRLCGPTGDTV